MAFQIRCRAHTPPVVANTLVAPRHAMLLRPRLFFNRPPSFVPLGPLRQFFAGPFRSYDNSNPSFTPPIDIRTPTTLYSCLAEAEQRLKERNALNTVRFMVEAHTAAAQVTMKSEIRKVIDNQNVMAAIDLAMEDLASRIMKEFEGRVEINAAEIEKHIKLPATPVVNQTQGIAEYIRERVTEGVENDGKQEKMGDKKEEDKTVLAQPAAPSKVTLDPVVKDKIRRTIDKAVDSYALKFRAVSAPYIKAEIVKQIKEFEQTRLLQKMTNALEGKEKVKWYRDWDKATDISRYTILLLLAGGLLGYVSVWPSIPSKVKFQQKEQSKTEMPVAEKEGEALQNVQKQEKEMQGAENQMGEGLMAANVAKAIEERTVKKLEEEEESKPTPPKEERKSMLPAGWIPRLVYVGGGGRRAG